MRSMRTTNEFESSNVNYNRTYNRYTFEVDYGMMPYDHRVKIVFAYNYEDALCKVYDLIPSAIIYDIRPTNEILENVSKSC